MSETAQEYMVVDERTGKVLVAGVNLDKALQTRNENPYDYRILWQKALLPRKGQ